MVINPETQKKPFLTSAGLWVRQNLFSSPGNTMLTLIGIALITWAVPPVIRWVFIDATWLGDSRTACDAVAEKTGACWVFIKVRLNLFIYGFYPEVERWRINLGFTVLAGALLPLLMPAMLASKKRQGALFVLISAGIYLAWGAGCALFAAGFYFSAFMLARLSFKPFFFRPERKESLSWVMAMAGAIGAGGAVWAGMNTVGQGVASLGVSWAITLIAFPLFGFKALPVKTWQWILILSIYPVFAYFMFFGGVFGVAIVETHYWGGLFLTLVIACTGIVTSLPVGVLLALGRRSQMPAIKMLCIFFIELVRGVPLVSVLFMASVMFPLFLPKGAHFDKLLRALIGVSFFYAAYIAEIIRGGLQAIPKGQYEAAEALGWGYWKMMLRIIIPQALRLVIPGLANNILSLFKDTTLVAVIGLLDLLGVAKAAMADSQWLGFSKEAYIFAGAVFWVLCFSISRYSIYLERKYHESYHQ